jgi:superkiller protein 3
LEYASRVFSSLTHASYGRPASYDAIFPAFFVLDRYSKHHPDDATGLHLFGLVCERLGQIDLGVDLIQQAISILEAIYEETEDPVVERHFTMANSNLARLKLSALDYEGALESFESALGLLPEDSSSPSDIILRTQAQFGSGLAQFKLDNLEEALSLFEAALESAGDNILVKGQVTVLLAQTMWAIGTDGFKESAKAQLLEWYTFPLPPI